MSNDVGCKQIVLTNSCLLGDPYLFRLARLGDINSLTDSGVHTQRRGPTQLTQASLSITPTFHLRPIKMESPAQMSSTSAKPPSTMDRDGEKRDPNSISSQNGTEDEAGFAPIHTADLPNPISRKTTHSQSIARVRSNNGYGVSENVRVKGETGDEESEEFETNPFEVGWDGGDNDPECPRSMTKLKKWTIACIVCGGSFCV